MRSAPHILCSRRLPRRGTIQKREWMGGVRAARAGDWRCKFCKAILIDYNFDYK